MFFVIVEWCCLREELEWSRLELGLMTGGCFKGGMRVADALEEKVEVI